MSRPKKQTESLSIAEKKYIDLMLKTSNNINYNELFKRLSAELDLSEDSVRDYANKLTPPVVDQQLPPEPAPKELQPQQKMVRDLMTPNRQTEPNKARHVTVMSEAASSQTEKMTPTPLKGSSKTAGSIFRQ